MKKSDKNLLTGCDLSKWNDVNNYQLLASCVDFAFLRAGRGQKEDEKFREHYEGLTSNGVPVGAYWFCYADSEDEAKREAEFMFKILKDKEILYPVVYDLEYDSVQKMNNPSPGKVSKIADAFLSEVEKAGYYAMIYTNEHFRGNWFAPDLFTKYDMWYARYGVNSVNCGSIWQYTSTGVLAAVNGNVDMNFSKYDYAKIIKEKGLNGTGKKNCCCNCCDHAGGSA